MAIKTGHSTSGSQGAAFHATHCRLPATVGSKASDLPTSSDIHFRVEMILTVIDAPTYPWDMNLVEQRVEGY